MEEACSMNWGDKKRIKILIGRLKGRPHFGESRVDIRLMLRRILRRHVGRGWAGLIWLRIGTSSGLQRKP
jgi:hypothetical protein